MASGLIVIAVLIFIALLLRICHILINAKHEEVHKRIAGLNALPLPSAIAFVYRVNHQNFFEEYEKLFRKYGRIVGLWGLRRFVIFSMDVELNELLMLSPVHITKHRNYDSLKLWLGTGLLLSNGRKWHQRRKIITPTFHFKILEDFLPVFDQQSSVALQCLAEVAEDGKTTVDIYPFMCRLALDIIAETAMGTKVNAQVDKTMPYTSAVQE